MKPMSLKSWRRAREITIKQMAEKCGVHENTYRAWEKEPGKIPVGKAIVIADALDVSIDDISFR